MQKSNLFLSGTALLLTIAGALATKASKLNKQLTVYTQASDACNRVNVYFSSTTINNNGLNKRHVLVGSNNKTVYTRGNGSSSNCGNTVYTFPDM